MSSAIMSLLISHILTFVESEIIKEEPALVATLVQDIESLISKLENLIEGKSTKASAITTPVLNTIGAAAVSAVEAAGAAVAANGN
jgi:hypothetical protein